MSDTNSVPKIPWVTFASALGAFVLFLLILAVAYLPKKAGAIAEGTRTPEERKAALAELHAKERSAANSYTWLDRDKGTVQLPVSRAVELTIQEINSKKK